MASTAKTKPLNRDNMTVLQQHAEYFDRNKDGYVGPIDTYQGFRALGFGYFWSVMAIFLINGTMAFATSDRWWPTLFINIRNIHRAKHGSDSQIYDEEGHMNESKFEEIFSRYDANGDGHLSLGEVWRMTEKLRNANDFYGWFAAKLEWLFLYTMAAQNGKLSKERVKKVYDGTLFYAIEAEISKKAGKMHVG
eukprot:TRINITY_DN5269_c0_g1_i1.p1 TRINITY_DN5269_c0_g1~~TRINITY_DN5269_c0_g1_i1.p1  ORF type:complete len:217 (-),score=52.55 TRINITY_DN5269_c0_g1_i1:195-773(-)